MEADGCALCESTPDGAVDIELRGTLEADGSLEGAIDGALEALTEGPPGPNALGVGSTIIEVLAAAVADTDTGAANEDAGGREDDCEGAGADADGGGAPDIEGTAEVDRGADSDGAREDDCEGMGISEDDAEGTVRGDVDASGRRAAAEGGPATGELTAKGREDDDGCIDIGGTFDGDGTDAVEGENDGGPTRTLSGLTLITPTTADIVGAVDGEGSSENDADGTGCVDTADAIGKRNPVHHDMNSTLVYI